MEYRKKLYIDCFLHQRLKEHCQERGERMINVTRRAIRIYLQQKEIETQK
jgi:hypothetical protein